MKDHLKRMFRSMAWADGRSLEALRSSPTSQADGLPLLAHLLAAEHVWLARLERRVPLHSPWPNLTLEQCEALAISNAEGYAAYLDRAGEAELTSAVHYRNTKGEEFTNSALDILTHVVTHGPYHRGQVARIIGRSGGEAPDTDFITFVRTIEPTGD